MIAEVYVKFHYQVAIAVLEQRSSAVPLHTKQACSACRGNEGVMPLEQGYGTGKKAVERKPGRDIKERKTAARLWWRVAV